MKNLELSFRDIDVGSDKEKDTTLGSDDDDEESIRSENSDDRNFINDTGSEKSGSDTEIESVDDENREMNEKFKVPVTRKPVSTLDKKTQA